MSTTVYRVVKKFKDELHSDDIPQWPYEVRGEPMIELVRVTDEKTKERIKAMTEKHEEYSDNEKYVRQYIQHVYGFQETELSGDVHSVVGLFAALCSEVIKRIETEENQ